MFTTQVKNMLRRKKLESMLRIALEEPYDIIEKAIPLWKNKTKYRFLYANLLHYISYANDASYSVMSPNYENVD